MWKIICLITLFRACSGDFDLSSLKVNLAEQNMSEECYLQFEEIDQLSFQKMIDSSSTLKLLGVMEGNFVNLGVYDECLSIANDTSKIYGKYCLTSIRLDEMVRFQEKLQVLVWRKIIKKFKHIVETTQLGIDVPQLQSILTGKIEIAICIPDKCTAEDFQYISPLTFDEDSCYTTIKNTQMNTSAIIAISIIYGFLVVAICSTAYDVICIIRTTKPRHQIFISFSLYTNGRKLFKPSITADELGCLHGIRGMSLMRVIMGHTYMNVIQTGMIDNYEYFNEWLDEPTTMLILTAALSVDTYLTIGGLLTVTVFMKSKPKSLKENIMKVPLLYVHRYIRLTPALAIMVLAYGSGLIKYIGDGPRWSNLNSYVNNCAKNWWVVFTFMQNYNPSSELCVGQSWYLSVDFQLFFLTPLLLFPLRKWPKLVIKLMCALAILGMIIPFCVGYTNNLSAVGLGLRNWAFTNEYFFFTHTRFAPYVIGMIAGYFLHVIKKREKPLTFHIGTLLLLWTLILTGLLVCIFDGTKLVRDDNSKWASGFYLALNRPAWSLMISFVILLCCTDNGGPINAFLSHPVFQIISKLSYSMFLLHYIVIIAANASSRTELHFSNFVTITRFFSFFVLILCISILFCLLFESPLIVIESIIFPKRDKKVEVTELFKERTIKFEYIIEK